MDTNYLIKLEVIYKVNYEKLDVRSARYEAADDLAIRIV